MTRGWGTMPTEELMHSAPSLRGDGVGRSGVVGAASASSTRTSALHEACCQSVIIQERRTEGDGSLAKYSVPRSLCLLFSCSPPPPLSSISISRSLSLSLSLSFSLRSPPSSPIFSLSLSLSLSFSLSLCVSLSLSPPLLAYSTHHTLSF